MCIKKIGSGAIARSKAPLLHSSGPGGGAVELLLRGLCFERRGKKRGGFDLFSVICTEYSVEEGYNEGLDIICYANVEASTLDDHHFLFSGPSRLARERGHIRLRAIRSAENTGFVLFFFLFFLFFLRVSAVCWISSPVSQ